MKTIHWVKWLSIVFFLIPMLFILLFPFIVMISTSFKTLREVSQIRRPSSPARRRWRTTASVEYHPAGEALPQQPFPGFGGDGDRLLPGHSCGLRAVPVPLRRPRTLHDFLLFTQMFPRW